jgi:hypothetical protein
MSIDDDMAERVEELSFEYLELRNAVTEAEKDFEIAMKELMSFEKEYPEIVSMQP